MKRKYGAPHAFFEIWEKALTYCTDIEKQKQTAQRKTGKGSAV